jgi:predicted transcriptional regulator
MLTSKSKSPFVYRSKTDIIVDVIGVIIIKKEKANKTNIQQAANLNHRQVEKYLSHIQSMGLIKKEEKNGHMIYHATDVGMTYYNSMLQNRLHNLM